MNKKKAEQEKYMTDEQYKTLLRTLRRIEDAVITKHEIFAAAALTGLCANPSLDEEYKVTARHCRKYADAMIDELDIKPRVINPAEAAE